MYVVPQHLRSRCSVQKHVSNLEQKNVQLHLIYDGNAATHQADKHILRGFLAPVWSYTSNYTYIDCHGAMNWFYCRRR